MRQLTTEEQQQLLKHLPPVDVKFPYRLGTLPFHVLLAYLWLTTEYQIPCEIYNCGKEPYITSQDGFYFLIYVYISGDLKTCHWSMQSCRYETILFWTSYFKLQKDVSFNNKPCCHNLLVWDLSTLCPWETH